jgi:hypothetical protein
MRLATCGFPQSHTSSGPVGTACEDVLPLAERKGDALIDDLPVVIELEKPADTTF